MNEPTSHHIQRNASLIESILCSYMGYDIHQASKDYITSLPTTTLEDLCPSALNLPASLIVVEDATTAHISIHLRDDFYAILDGQGIDKMLFNNEDDLSALLILSEEISHFHYYVRHALTGTKVTRLEMELQAELEKIIISTLLFHKLFGHSHIHFLTKKVFDESTITGSLTDYEYASKHAEKFWKLHVQALGEDLLHNSSFRRYLQQIGRRTGLSKQQLMSEGILKIAA